MNRFVKKLLAKYIKYIEIIGYFFVVLFIAGLVALSFIKAEDEYVGLNGKYQIDFQMIKYEKPHYILDLRSENGATVSANSPLFELTDDDKFIADRTIQTNLEAQLETARNAGQRKLANNLAAIILEIEERDYPKLDYSVERAPIEGAFFLIDSSDFIPAEVIKGGVFNFEEATIRVTQFPSDKRLVKKVKQDQAGTATIKLGPVEKIVCTAIVSEVSKSEILLNMETIPVNEKLKIINFIAARPDDVSIDVSVNVLVGWKSWMRLIWR